MRHQYPSYSIYSLISRISCSVHYMLYLNECSKLYAVSKWLVNLRYVRSILFDAEHILSWLAALIGIYCLF